MTENKATKFQKQYFGLSFDQSAEPSLRAYFGRVREGQPDEYRTPFYEGKSIESILAEWDAKLLSIKNDWPTLYDFESDLRAKVGPMSIMKPLAERMDDIESYFQEITSPGDPVADEAIQAVIAEWGECKRSIRIRSQVKTVENMKKSTNSGSPYFTKRRCVVNQTIPCKSYLYDDDGTPLVAQVLNGQYYDAAAILGWRGQEGGPSPADVKQRVVWMFPFAVNVAELCLYQPFKEVAQKRNIIPAWVSMDAVDLSVTRLFDTKATSDLIICTDFTKFDQHFNSNLQAVARQVLGELVTPSEESEDWLTNVFPIKYNIPLAYDWNRVRFGTHGMGSGSGGTNDDETLAHRALQYEAAMRSNAKLNPHSQCLGDDGILSFPGCDVNSVVRAYSSHGLEMNTDKQYASTDTCTYLRRWHHNDYRMNNVCVGVYSTFRAIGRLCEQERWYNGWSKEMVAMRQLSILENCKYHPLREEFAAFCMKGDRYGLGSKIPGFLENIGKYAREAIDYIPDFMGYTRSLENDGNPAIDGIQNWWIINYLKSVA